MEKPLGAASKNESTMNVDHVREASSSKAAGLSGLPKGYGRIIRDADGNVVDVELADEDEEEPADGAERLVEDIPDPSKQKGLVDWVAVGSKPGAANTHVVQSEFVRQSSLISRWVLIIVGRLRWMLGLEELVQTRGGPALRHSSHGELGVLRRLVAKYKDDVDAMARDRKLNVDQRSAGQLARAIKKAGGVEELLKGS